jgi:hypothetical protein
MKLRSAASVANHGPRKIVEPARRRDGQTPHASRFGRTMLIAFAIGSHPAAVPPNIFRIACASR